MNFNPKLLPGKAFGYLKILEYPKAIEYQTNSNPFGYLTEIVHYEYRTRLIEKIEIIRSDPKKCSTHTAPPDRY